MNDPLSKPGITDAYLIALHARQTLQTQQQAAPKPTGPLNNAGLLSTSGRHQAGQSYNIEAGHMADICTVLVALGVAGIVLMLWRMRRQRRRDAAKAAGQQFEQQADPALAAARALQCRLAELRELAKQRDAARTSVAANDTEVMMFDVEPALREQVGAQ